MQLRLTEKIDLMLFISKEWRNAAKPCSIAYSIKEHEDIIASPDQIHLKSITEEDKIVSFIVLEGLLQQNRSINIKQMVVHPANQGYGRQTIHLFKAYCFEELAMHRISVEVFSFHTSAIKLFESEGFKIEGVLRDAKLDDKGFHDLTILSILSDQ